MSDVIPQYPWSEGEHLFASALNAAIADGPYLNNWNVRNVVDFGADPTGVRDSAPAFRAAMGSNSRILVPPGTYLFNSTLPLPPPYGVGANPGVIVASFTNFLIEGYGATIIFGTAITTGGQQANQMAAILFDRCTEFSVRGLTFQGNVTGLTIPSQPNVGLFCMSCTDFRFEDIHFTGYFVFAIDGDWWVNGLFRNIVVDGAIYGFDIAYLYRCVFDNCRLIGSDCVGTGVTHTGSVGFSCIVDPPNAGTNFTAIPTASFTAHNTYRNCSATNFSTGWYATTGRYYLLQGNRWINNPGLTSPSTPGIGVLLGYDAINGVGVPVSNFTVVGDTFFGNGANAAGQGFRFANPTGSDFISDVTIADCQFDNNTNTGIGAPAANNLRRLQAIGNVFTGANQTSAIASALVGSNAFTDIVGGLGYDVFSSGRVVSQLFGGAGAFTVSDGVHSAGMFVNGTGMALGATTTAGVPTLVWASLVAGLTTFAGNTMAEIAASVTDGTNHFGMFMNGASFALGPTTSTGAPATLWLTFDSVGNISINHLVDATGDANAASLGVPVGALYKSSGAVRVRLV